VWCALLQRFPQAYLVLFSFFLLHSWKINLALRSLKKNQVMIRYRHYMEAETHLKMEAQKRGVSAQRLLFVKEGSHKVCVCV